MQQRIPASHSLAAGNEGDAWQAWVTLLLHMSVSEGSLTSLVLGLSTQMRNHCLSVLHLDKRALWHAESNQTQKFRCTDLILKEDMKCYYILKGTCLRMLDFWVSAEVAIAWHSLTVTT